jgi:hypothetical protein
MFGRFGTNRHKLIRGMEDLLVDDFLLVNRVLEREYSDTSGLYLRVDTNSDLDGDGLCQCKRDQKP